MNNIIYWLSLSLIMVLCIITDIITCNWIALVICVIGLVLNIINLFSAFKNWQEKKEK